MADQPRHREPSHQEQHHPGRGEPYDVRNPQVHGSSDPGAAGYTPAPPVYREPEHHGGRAEPPQHRTEEPESRFRNIGRRVSWGAIFAGVLIALSVQLLLSVLGIGIGAAAFDPVTTGTEDATGWTIGAGVWWVLTGLIALFLGGWVAGHLATNPDRRDGAIHGIVTWSLATLIGVWLLTTTLGTVTAGAWTVVTEGQQSGLQMPAGAGEPEPQQQPQQPPDQDSLQDPQQQQQILQQADDAVAHAGIWTFVAMVLGAAAAGFGGYLATPGNAPNQISRR